MKTVADLSVKQLQSLANIAMLNQMRQVIFMGDSPKSVIKAHFEKTMDPYMLRILLKVLPDLNVGRTPVITDNDEPGLMLVKATWCGIRAYGLQNFFAGSRPPRDFGSLKREYLFDSVCPTIGSLPLGEAAMVRKTIEFYASTLESIHASNNAVELMMAEPGLVKKPHHNIGDYWNNLLAARHLGKDPVKWDAHVKKNAGEIRA